jgi:hypothetical protein
MGESCAESGTSIFTNPRMIIPVTNTVLGTKCWNEWLRPFAGLDDETVETASPTVGILFVVAVCWVFTQFIYFFYFIGGSYGRSNGKCDICGCV